MSRCVETETYSPTAIDNAPAATAAMPAVSNASWLAPDAATPMTRPDTDTMPSLAPSTPARSQLSVPLVEPSCCSPGWGSRGPATPAGRDQSR
ncbi:hypothetical protein GCM10025862_01560 [Arsenicicoccus piscis]|uniref:Uncharacterized protein n=1 Tax=Arsenicicoccus piscis TaxID=673954 RepID=A0ABQ6HKK8_9MICO|nr:hypothetical protein GCM10025862_01560 [Arsenicicoccus piscis]